MATILKPISDQIMVITGASSGIGLVTARMAAKKGVRLVLASRSEDALRQLSDELTLQGPSQAVYVVADVGRQEDVHRIAQKAIDTFGGFDTWVNNAGASIYGKTEEVPIEDMKRLFDTNFWGVVYGSLEAVKHLKHRGGTIINIGSVLSERAVNLQGIYSATKHAVKGFTDSLRMELEQEGYPIAVSLIKPTGIDTPYPLHAKNYMEREAKLPSPVYAPETVAEAILHCAEEPMAHVYIGGAARMIAGMGRTSARLTDKVMEGVFTEDQKMDAPPRPLEDNGLDHAAGRLEERGNYPGYVMKTSLYTKAMMNPGIAAAGIAAAGLGLALLLRGKDRVSNE